MCMTFTRLGLAGLAATGLWFLSTHGPGAHFWSLRRGSNFLSCVASLSRSLCEGGDFTSVLVIASGHAFVPPCDRKSPEGHQPIREEFPGLCYIYSYWDWALNDCYPSSWRGEGRRGGSYPCVHCNHNTYLLSFWDNVWGSHIAGLSLHTPNYERKLYQMRFFILRPIHWAFEYQENNSTNFCVFWVVADS